MELEAFQALLALPLEFTPQKCVELLTFGERNHQLAAKLDCTLY